MVSKCPSNADSPIELLGLPLPSISLLNLVFLRISTSGTTLQGIGSKSDPLPLAPSASSYLTCVRGEQVFVGHWAKLCITTPTPVILGGVFEKENGGREPLVWKHWTWSHPQTRSGIKSKAQLFTVEKYLGRCILQASFLFRISVMFFSLNTALTPAAEKLRICEKESSRCLCINCVLPFHLIFFVEGYNSRIPSTVSGLQTLEQSWPYPSLMGSGFYFFPWPPSPQDHLLRLCWCSPYVLSRALILRPIITAQLRLIIRRITACFQAWVRAGKMRRSQPILTAEGSELLGLLQPVWIICYTLFPADWSMTSFSLEPWRFISGPLWKSLFLKPPMCETS